MSYNPSDKEGPLASQTFQYAVVVDDKDPDESGRFKCRILGEQDDEGKIPDDKLPWVACMTNNQPQLRQVGKFPAGNYAIGSKVVMFNLGQQGWVIMGAVTNHEKPKNKADKHDESTSTSPKLIVNILGNIFTKILGGKGLFNNKTTSDGISPTTQTAYSLMNGILPSVPFNDDPIKAIREQAKTEAKYDLRSAAKVLSGFKSFGNVAFNKMDMTNPTKEVARISQELIPNAVSMIEQLKKTAKSGQNVLASNSVGGLGNIIGAIQGVASMIKKESSKNNTQDNANLLEEELRRLYKELTKKEPLNEFGKETAQYIKWKQAYLNGEILYE
jgi:hypothetical protein